MLLVFPFALPIINAVIDTYTHSVTHIHRERERASLTCECCQQLEGSVVAMAAPATHKSSLTHYYQTTFTSSPSPPPPLPLSTAVWLSVCQLGGLARKCIGFIWISISASKHISIFICTPQIRFPLFTAHSPDAAPLGPRPAGLPNFFGFPALFA